MCDPPTRLPYPFANTFSCIGYMKAVKGEMRGSFESMIVCAGMLMRFPGICRYRYATFFYPAH